jgi:hypothetical protein
MPRSAGDGVANPVLHNKPTEPTKMVGFAPLWVVYNIS